MQIQKPLLAATFDPDKAEFPYLATEKIDGIRFLMVNGQAVSRSFKPIRNKYIQRLLSESLPDGIDGELTCGSNFQDSSSGIMSIEGEPEFQVWIFDYVDPELDTILDYTERLEQLHEMEATGTFAMGLEGKYVVLYPSEVNSIEEVEEAMENITAMGFEGLMLRDPRGTYKFGRASVKSNILLKVKKFQDDEAVVVGFTEKMSNQNEPTRDAFGYIDRATAKDGLVPADTLGAFILDYKGETLRCGSGLNDELRKEIWDNQEEYVGKMVKFKYMSHGVKDLPRHPIFLGFRDADDMS